MFRFCIPLVVVITSCSSPCLVEKEVDSDLGKLQALYTFPNCENDSRYHVKFTHPDGWNLEGDVQHNQLVGIWHMSNPRRKMLSFAMLNESDQSNTLSGNGFPLDQAWWKSANVRYIGYQRNSNVKMEGHIKSGQRLGSWNYYSAEMDTTWKGAISDRGPALDLEFWPYPVTGRRTGNWVGYGSRNVPLESKCYLEGHETECTATN